MCGRLVDVLDRLRLFPRQSTRPFYAIIYLNFFKKKISFTILFLFFSPFLCYYNTQGLENNKKKFKKKLIFFLSFGTFFFWHFLCLQHSGLTPSTSGSRSRARALSLALALTHLLHHVDQHLLELLTTLRDEHYVAIQTLPVLALEEDLDNGDGNLARCKCVRRKARLLLHLCMCVCVCVVYIHPRICVVVVYHTDTDTDTDTHREKERNRHTHRRQARLFFNLQLPRSALRRPPT